MFDISLAETKKTQKSEFPIPQDPLFLTDPENFQLVTQGANFPGEIFRVCNWARVKAPVFNVRRGRFIFYSPALLTSENGGGGRGSGVLSALTARWRKE